MINENTTEVSKAAPEQSKQRFLEIRIDNI